MDLAVGGTSDRNVTGITRSALTGPAERGLLAGAFYLAGGGLILLTVVDPRGELGWLVALGSTGVVVGLASLLLRRWFVYAATVVTSFAGPPLIAAATVAGGGGWASAIAGVLYTFVAVHTALVLRRWHAVLVLSWGAVTAWIAAELTFPEVPAPLLLATYVLTSGTLFAVTSWLVQKVQQQAATDPLTGLANRLAFEAALEHARATVTRTDEPLSLVMLDLDRFKQINDTQGHAAGDAVLLAASRAWGEQLRGRDVLARLGGDEFAVILPGADDAAARDVARRLREVMPEGTSCSTGAATWDGAQTLTGLVQAADRALYAAKAQRSFRASADATAGADPAARTDPSASER